MLIGACNPMLRPDLGPQDTDYASGRGEGTILLTLTAGLYTVMIEGDLTVRQL